MYHSIPDLRSPKGVQSFLEKLQNRAWKMKDVSSEKEMVHEILVSEMEYLLVTRPARRLSDMIWANSQARNAKRQMEERARTYIAPKTQYDVDHDAMESEIAGEYFVNS